MASLSASADFTVRRSALIILSGDWGLGTGDLASHGLVACAQVGRLQGQPQCRTAVRQNWRTIARISQRCQRVCAPAAASRRSADAASSVRRAIARAVAADEPATTASMLRDCATAPSPRVGRTRPRNRPRREPAEPRATRTRTPSSGHRPHRTRDGCPPLVLVPADRRRRVNTTRPDVSDALPHDPSVSDGEHLAERDRPLARWIRAIRRRAHAIHERPVP